MQTEAKDVEKAFCARISAQNGGEACSIAWLIAVLCSLHVYAYKPSIFPLLLNLLFHVLIRCMRCLLCALSMAAERIYIGLGTFAVQHAPKQCQKADCESRKSCPKQLIHITKHRDVHSWPVPAVQEDAINPLTFVKLD